MTSGGDYTSVNLSSHFRSRFSAHDFLYIDKTRWKQVIRLKTSKPLFIQTAKSKEGISRVAHFEVHGASRGVPDGRAGGHVVRALRFDGEVRVTPGVRVQGGRPLCAERWQEGDTFTNRKLAWWQKEVQFITVLKGKRWMYVSELHSASWWPLVSNAENLVSERRARDYVNGLCSKNMEMSCSRNMYNPGRGKQNALNTSWLDAFYATFQKTCLGCLVI